jgi:Flp pilus assembly protein TadG
MRRGQRGASVLEFALCVPIFFAVIVGTIEFGRGMFAANELNHLAREAIRFAVVHSNESDSPASEKHVIDYVRRRAVSIVGDDITVNTAWSPSNTPGAFVEVTLRYEFEPVLAILPDSLRNLRGYSRGVVAN